LHCTIQQRVQHAPHHQKTTYQDTSSKIPSITNPEYLQKIKSTDSNTNIAEMAHKQKTDATEEQKTPIQRGRYNTKVT
jgi:hypothetical protein